VVFPVLVAAVIWYLVLCTILMIGQYFLERHFGKGYGTAGRARQKLRDIEVEQSGRMVVEGGGST
jgi:polar amino acid transport system permease protein